MNRLGRPLLPAVLLIAALLTGCGVKHLALAAFYDSAMGQGILYHIDQEGQLYYLNFDSGEWEADGSPCPGTPPYDLDGWYNPNQDSWAVVAVDGRGVLWHSTDAWYQITEPLDAKGSHALDGFYDYALGNDIIKVMNPHGQLYNYFDEGWTEIDEPCPGKGPYDLTVFYDVTSDLYWTSTLDGEGKNFDLLRGGWVQDGTAIKDGPFRISGFHDVAADAYLFYVIDGKGNLYTWEGDDWVDVGAKVPGKAPFDLDAFYDPDADAYYVMAINADGKVYQFTGEDWSLQY